MSDRPTPVPCCTEADGWVIAASPGVVHVGPFLRADGSTQPCDALAQACGLSVGSVLPTINAAEASRC